MASSGSGRHPLADVHLGMRVADRDNELIGTVAAVTMGDPWAVTLQGQRQRAELVEGVIDTVLGTEPNVPPQRAEQLLRTGYVTIDAIRFLGTDLFAGAEELGNVDGNLVRLSVPGRHLIPES